MLRASMFNLFYIINSPQTHVVFIFVYQKTLFYPKKIVFCLTFYYFRCVHKRNCTKNPCKPIVNCGEKYVFLRIQYSNTACAPSRVVFI